MSGRKKECALLWDPVRTFQIHCFFSSLQIISFRTTLFHVVALLTLSSGFPKNHHTHRQSLHDRDLSRSSVWLRKVKTPQPFRRQGRSCRPTGLDGIWKSRSSYPENTRLVGMALVHPSRSSLHYPILLTVRPGRIWWALSWSCLVSTLDKFEPKEVTT